uniref:Uncharacterized protein n=1 Tax=Anguilla anguilla TaxID=7936 RepID=A0A0E9SD78_ANGAN
MFQHSNGFSNTIALMIKGFECNGKTRFCVSQMS